MSILNFTGPGTLLANCGIYERERKVLGDELKMLVKKKNNSSSFLFIKLIVIVEKKVGEQKKQQRKKKHPLFHCPEKIVMF